LSRLATGVIVICSLKGSALAGNVRVYLTPLASVVETVPPVSPTPALVE
jgi:hypothetical protein